MHRHGCLCKHLEGRVINLVINFMNLSVTIGLKQVVLLVGLVGAIGTLLVSAFGPVAVIFLLGLAYLVLRYSIEPLSQFIARLGYSIRWKQEVAITVIAGLFLIVTFIHVQAMNFMHDELHTIQELGHPSFKRSFGR